MYKRFRESIDNVVNKYGNKTAITYIRNSGENIQLLFADIKQFLYETEESIIKYGLQKGDRVAIVSPHSPWAAFTGISLAYVGITIVLIDATLPQEEIEKLLEFSEVKALFTTEEIYHRFEPNIKMPCFSLDEGLGLELLRVENAEIPRLGQAADSDEDVIAILYSSGTTGEMKGIMVTYESVLKAREIFVRLSGLKDYMTYLLVLPFNHIAGFTGAMTFFLTGCEIGFIEDVNASKLQNGLLKFQPYYFAMVPKVYEVMEQKIRATIHEKGKGTEMLINTMFKISKFFRKYFGINIGRKMFKSIIKQVFGENIFGIGTGASPCKDETTEFFLNLGLEWANLYATTETSVPIVATGVHDKYPVNTVGNVTQHPEIEIQIKNPDSTGIGEIMVKSELMMKGYFKRPDLTAEAFDGEFFKTGDYGYVDKKGYLHITGRIKESIVLQNGKKVSPADVDDYYLMRIPDYDIASRGIVNEKEEYDEIHMFVADKEYTDFERKEIKMLFKEISREAPSMYKLSEIHFISDIPRTSVGKVKRFCLKPKNEIKVDRRESNKSTDLKLIEIISSHCDIENISLDSSIVEDLGLDSLTMFTIVCEIETAYGVDISSYLEKLVTVKDIYELISHDNIVKKENYLEQKSEKKIKSLKKWITFVKLFYTIETIGKENIPEYSDYIICANHESYFDPLWILAAMKDKVDLRKICCMAAKHTMEGRVSRNLFDSLGGISVDRAGNTIPAMSSAMKCLENGQTLIVFPEGARSRDGSLLPFKSGAAKLAIEANKSIIPVSIDGAFEIFPRWKKYPRFFDWKHFRRFRLTIQFGVPIKPDAMTAEELTAQIRRYIEASK